MPIWPSVEWTSREASIEHQQLKRGRVIMKKTIIVLACTLIVPVAFAQTSTTTTETSTSSQGTVTTYEPGKRIVVRTEREDNPISYVLGKTAHYVDKDGKKIDKHLIRPGSRVIVYTSRGQMHAAKRVVLDQD